MLPSTKDLFERYLRNECSQDEIQQLLKQFGSATNEAELKEYIYEFLLSGEPAKVPLHLLEKTRHPDKAVLAMLFPTARPIRFYHTRWFRYTAAAASLTLLIGTGIRILHKKTQQSTSNTTLASNIKPAQFGATLTLANGSTIALDSAANGQIAQQNGARVMKSNGAVTYQPNGTSANNNIINQITTPRGHHYALKLSDGTSVWLNAASSLRFPASFSGKERTVEVQGEAYFEVAANPNTPFRVKILSAKGASEILVLGTHFNVHAYDEEATTKTTLLEGRIKVIKGNTSQLLRPGQQAITAGNEQIAVKQDIDTDEIMGWKNGVFIFNREDIKTIMQQISRWYDVEVVYNNIPVTETFSGIVSRDSDVSQVLKIMEANGLKFKIENKTITIL